MTKEEQLKAFILTKYKSLREFTQEFDIPYSTMSTILKRGIDNSNVTNIIKICQALNISADELAEGKIVPVVINESNTTCIENIISYAKQRLLNSKNLTINDKKVTDDVTKRIVTALDVILEIEKRNCKG